MDFFAGLKIALMLLWPFLLLFLYYLIDRKNFRAKMAKLFHKD